MRFILGVFLVLVTNGLRITGAEQTDDAKSRPGGPIGDSPGICTSVGYYPHPEDCDKFYRCVAGVPVLQPNGNGVAQYQKHSFQCAPGTSFDPESESCTFGGGQRKGHCGHGPPVPVPPPTPESELCRYTIDVVRSTGAPDGVTKDSMLTYNGKFPGPVLRCQRGKYLVVRINNKLKNLTTTVHWHGIEQNLSPFFDGPEGITQCPILPGTSMEYKFQLFQAGTYWYHSHDGQQYTEGAWGALIVDNTPQEVWSNLYDDEFIITLNDWHHMPAPILLEIFRETDDFPLPDSILINGIGKYNCTKAHENGFPCTPNPNYPAVVRVVPGKKYRLRVINTAASSRFDFSIDGHQLIVIETDGVDTLLSRPVDMVQIWTAQRYSFILNANGNLDEYWIRSTGDLGGEVLAILKYDRAAATGIPNVTTTVDIEDAIPQGEQSRPAIPNINWESLAAKRACGRKGGRESRSNAEFQDDGPFQHFSFFEDEESQMALPADREMETSLLRLPTTTPTSNPVILNQQDCHPYRNGGEAEAPNYFDQEVVIVANYCPGSPGPGTTSRLCLNGVQFNPGPPGSKPVLFQFIEGLLLTNTGAQYHTPELNRVIQVVINNREAHDHPWHMHGHTFWVMGTGAVNSGDYSAARDEAHLLTNTVRRDTTGTLAKSWAVIRYYTGNPGVWFFHCHINWHLGLGFGAVFAEARGIAQQIYCEPPDEVQRVCRRSGVNVF